MIKKLLIGTVAVFIAWQILDYVIHVIIFTDSYAATAHLWRPEGEMKMGLMMIVSLLAALFFVALYVKLVSPKTLQNGLWYGVLFGLATGISMGYGTYSVQPITYGIAIGWFLGSLVEATVAGLLLGLLVKEDKKEAA
jgi:prepilin signal peptidase PulO-like enzyme (type II secretory pathway)